MAVGDPTGEDLCSGTTNGNTLPESQPPPPLPEEREITLGAGVELTEGVKYAIVIRAPDASVWTDEAIWALKSVGGYAVGNRHYSSDSGLTWGTSTSDLWFKTYAGANLKDSFTFEFEERGSILYNSSWSAQTFTATSTYTITSVILYLYRKTGASPGTITVGIRDTEVFTPPIPTAKNTMFTIKRLIAAANSKIWYEDI